MREHKLKSKCSMLRLAIAVCTIVGLNAAEIGERPLLASDYALSFDGINDYVYFMRSDSLLPEAAYNSGTMMAWVKHTDSWPLERQALFGFSYSQGPGLHLQNRGETDDGGSKYIVRSETGISNCTYASPIVDDQKWHHIAHVYDYTQGSVEVYFDGVLHAICIEEGPIRDDVYEDFVREFSARSSIVLGSIGPQPKHNVLFSNFAGLLDDYRLYTIPLTQDDVRQAMLNTPAQPDFSSNSSQLFVWLDFRTGARDGNVVPVLGNGIQVQTGDGVNEHKPNFVISDAPINSRQDAAEVVEYPSIVVFRGNQSTPIVIELLSATEAPVYTQLQILGVVEGPTSDNGSDEVGGTISTGQDPTAPNYTLADIPVTLEGTRVYFTPYKGYAGNVTLLVAMATAEGERSMAVHARVETMRPMPPIPGHGGYALYCDGVDDYMYNPYFKWPVAEYIDPQDGIARVGGGPITIEGWMWLSRDASRAGTIVSVGAGVDTYDEEYSPNITPDKEYGSLYFSMPSDSPHEEYKWAVGTDEHNVKDSMHHSVKHLTDTWVHFAVTSTQVAGTKHQVYLNGWLHHEDEHDHNGVGAGLPGARVEGLTICSSLFFSDVYHEGLVDEVRIWNRVRTEDEIKSTMHRSLLSADGSLNESLSEGLVGYWNFDNPEEGVAYDHSGNNHHLRAGGCAVCNDGNGNDYYQGWARRANETVCLPVARNAYSEAYEGTEIHGGAHCYYSPELSPEETFLGYTLQSSAQAEAQQTSRDKSTSRENFTHKNLWYRMRMDEDTKSFPKRVLSKAPVGGTAFEQVFIYEYTLKPILLNITDVDGSGQALRIDHTVQNGVLYEALFDIEQPYEGPSITNNSLVSTYVPGASTATVYYRATDRGMNSTAYWLHPIRPSYESDPVGFSYSIFDGQTWGPSHFVGVRDVFRCDAGTIINRTRTRCQACQAGFYAAPSVGVETGECVQCSINYISEIAGNTEHCSPCPWGTHTVAENRTFCFGCEVNQPVNPYSLEYNNTCPYVVASPSEVIELGPLHDPEEDGDATFELVQYLEPGGGEIYNYQDMSENLSYTRTKREYPHIALVSNVTSNSESSHDEYPAGNMHGAPDNKFYRPFKNPEGSFVLEAILSDTLTYPIDIWVYMESGGPNVTKAEIYSDVEETYLQAWGGSEGVGADEDHVVIPFCRLNVLTNKIRITFGAWSASGDSLGPSLDAITYAGYKTKRGRRYAVLSDPAGRFIYTPTMDFGTHKHHSVLFRKYSCVAQGQTGTDVWLPLDTVTLTEVGEISSTALGFAIGVVVICELLLMMTLAGVIFLGQKHPRLKKASPLFMGLMLLGGMIALPTPIIIFVVEGVWGCYLGPILWEIGFVLTFGALFIKTYRIRYIFGNDLIKLNGGIKLSDKHLLKHLSALLLGITIYLSVYLGVYDVQRSETVINGIQWDMCQLGKMTVISITLQLTLMVVGTVLAFQVRKVPSDFSESKLIGISIYNWVFVSGVIIIVTETMDSSVNAMLVIQTMYLVVVFVVACALLVGYKLVRVLWDQRDRAKKGPHTSDSSELDQIPIGSISASGRCSHAHAFSNESAKQLGVVDPAHAPLSSQSQGVSIRSLVSGSASTDAMFSSSHMISSHGGAQLTYSKKREPRHMSDLSRSTSRTRTRTISDPESSVRGSVDSPNIMGGGASLDTPKGNGTGEGKRKVRSENSDDALAGVGGPAPEPVDLGKGALAKSSKLGPKVSIVQEEDG